MEDVDGDLLSGFPVGRDAHGQGEDAAMRHLVKRMQRELVTRRNRLDELCPILFLHSRRGLGVQYVSQRYRRLWTFLGHDGLISHADIVQILGRSIKARHGAPRLTPKRRKANDEVD
jgi:hypothetical protein